MSTKTCMTLRLDPAIDELVAVAAHDQGVTKTAWIRSAIRQRLAGTTGFPEGRTEHLFCIPRRVNTFTVPSCSASGWTRMNHMKQTKTPSSETQQENLDKLVEELGPDVVKALHRAYTLTAAALYRRAVEQAQAQLRQRQNI